MKNEQEKLNIHWKIQKPSWYLRPVEWIGSWFFAGIFGARTKFNHVNKVNYREPSLILSNHASFIDFPNVVVDMFPHRQCWVISIEEFVGRDWLFRHIGGIPKRKFTSDLTMIKNIVDLIKNQKNINNEIYNLQ